jgi:methylenetetrahydrofolate reductase (NADPH)
MHDLRARPPREDAPNSRLYALEVTGKDIAQIEASRADIRRATPINIAFLGNETHGQRIHAARVIRACGYEPVPIISSRRLRSQQDLDSLLSALIGEARPRGFILVGGDPTTPAGPYDESLALLKRFRQLEPVSLRPLRCATFAHS